VGRIGNEEVYDVFGIVKVEKNAFDITVSLLDKNTKAKVCEILPSKDENELEKFIPFDGKYVRVRVTGREEQKKNGMFWVYME
jgi:hypothetical protein